MREDKKDNSNIQFLSCYYLILVTFRHVLPKKFHIFCLLKKLY